MAITTISSRQFNQDTGGAKRAARSGPVFITDRGRASHVLVTIEDYRKLTDTGVSLVDRFAMKGGDDIEFDPPKLSIGLKIPDFD